MFVRRNTMVAKMFGAKNDGVSSCGRRKSAPESIQRDEDETPKTIIKNKLSKSLTNIAEVGALPAIHVISKPLDKEICPSPPATPRASPRSVRSQPNMKITATSVTSSTPRSTRNQQTEKRLLRRKTTINQKELLLIKIAKTLPYNLLTKTETKLHDFATVMGYHERNRNLIEREKLNLSLRSADDKRFTSLIHSLSPIYIR
ncbi:uncharacterized protein LOC141907643 [Tubulanus polymorphus]|uniref:uncharacterized protein LOC141907643 n=1 Tax=Tubulanus polymorphus TaxID=672921 RepID=UPI003DA5C50E